MGWGRYPGQRCPPDNVRCLHIREVSKIDARPHAVIDCPITRRCARSASEVIMRYLVLVLVVVAAASTSQAQQSKYYELPKGDYPHDVAVGPNGEVWYAGQKLGIAGRLEPATGKVDRIPLGKNSAPHGVIVGPDGAP